MPPIYVMMIYYGRMNTITAQSCVYQNLPKKSC